MIQFRALWSERKSAANVDATRARVLQILQISVPKKLGCAAGAAARCERPGFEKIQLLGTFTSSAYLSTIALRSGTEKLMVAYSALPSPNTVVASAVIGC